MVSLIKTKIDLQQYYDHYMTYPPFTSGFVCMSSDNGEANWHTVGFFPYLSAKTKLISGFGDLLRLSAVVLPLFINRLS